MAERRRIFLLIIIMVAVVICVSVVMLFVLYNMAFEQQRQRLVELAQSRARIMESVARFDEQYSDIGEFSSPFEATLSQIREAHEQFAGFGNSGEFTLAQLKEDKMVFLLRHRHFDLDDPDPVPFASEIAEPMRLALSGKSGTIVGLDYRGVLVLAAYEPVAVLDLGIVAKIDLSEINTPFVNAGIVGVSVGLIFILMGTALFWFISNPILHNIKEEKEKYHNLFEGTNDIILIIDAETKNILDFNTQAIKQLGYTQEELLSLEFKNIYPSSDEQLNETTEGRIFEHILLTKDGRKIPVEISSQVNQYNNQQVIQLSARNITQRKKAEAELRATTSHLQALFDALPDRIVTFDEDGRYLTMHAGHGMVVNYSQSPIGQLIHDIDGVPRHVADLVVKTVRQAIETDTLQLIEYSYPNPTDPSLVQWVEGRAVSLRRSVDGKQSALWVTRNITERKQAEEQLCKSEEHYRALFENAPIGIGVSIPDQKVFMINKALKEQFGYSTEELSQIDSASSYQNPGDRNRLFEQLERDGSVKDVEVALKRKDGTPYYGSLTMVPMPSLGDGVFMTMAIDITELKQAETLALEYEHLKTQFQKEQEHTALIERIVSTLSHDMRTPLSVIAMTKDILRRYFDKLTEEKRQEKLDIISHQIQFALRLLDDTVQMARGRHEFNPELVNLASLCQISIDEIHLAKNSNHQLIFDNVGKVETVVIDETLVSRILLNLLSNAIKYSPDGGEIHLELDKRNDSIILSVVDYGMGINSDNLQHVFDLLYRGDNVGDILGTGLGLSIVKDCVDRHQGIITVQSEVGKGSTFTVELPI